MPASPSARNMTPGRIRAAILTGVDTARAEQTAEFDVAVTELNALDPSQLTIVLAGIIRSLLEILHPDGLDSDDVQDALTDVAKASGWYEGVQPEALAEVLLGALGVLAPEDVTSSGSFPAHAVLVITVLSARQPMPLAELVTAELAEIQRAETMEMP